MAATKSVALPSMIGISGPSISTSTLSRPRPEQADIRCSMVDTDAELRSPMTVQSSVALTFVCLAWISWGGMPSMPVRRKTTPELALEGFRQMLAGAPEWTPIPVRVTAARKVVCRSKLMSYPILIEGCFRPAEAAATGLRCRPRLSRAAWARLSA
ncbi:hypothetical protein D3C87_1743390 [compost metagenome]